jgi:hypothetical protein
VLQNQTLSVDASLLKALGERLIGQPHIALAELVKNSYDADTAICKIIFGDDQIEITDDGSGMSENDFLEHWMRIGRTTRSTRPVQCAHDAYDEVMKALFDDWKAIPHAIARFAGRSPKDDQSYVRLARAVTREPRLLRSAMAFSPPWALVMNPAARRFQCQSSSRPTCRAEAPERREGLESGHPFAAASARAAAQ